MWHCGKLYKHLPLARVGQAGQLVGRHNNSYWCIHPYVCMCMQAMRNNMNMYIDGDDYVTVLASAGGDDVFHRLCWQGLQNAIEVYYVCNNGIFIKKCGLKVLRWK